MLILLSFLCFPTSIASFTLPYLYGITSLNLHLPICCLIFKAEFRNIFPLTKHFPLGQNFSFLLLSCSITLSLYLSVLLITSRIQFICVYMQVSLYSPISYNYLPAIYWSIYRSIYMKIYQKALLNGKLHNSSLTQLDGNINSEFTSLQIS